MPGKLMMDGAGSSTLMGLYLRRSVQQYRITRQDKYRVTVRMDVAI